MTYTADDIKIVSWPECIRNRPEMYFAHRGTEGCLWLLKELMEAILNEKYECNSTVVNLRLTRHKEIVIEYNGKGIPIENTKSGILQPLIYKSFMTLPGNSYQQRNYSRHGHLADIGSIFNVACKILHIKTNWQGKLYAMSFYQGCISSLLNESEAENKINSLRFVFDHGVMGDFELTSELLNKLVNNVQTKYDTADIKYGS